MKRLLISLLLILILVAAHGQIKNSESQILLQSRHLWRGSQLGNGISIEPSVTLHKNKFSMNFWAAFTLNKSYSEIDLIPSYLFRHFKLTLFDYYNPVAGLKNQYFNFKKGLNRHSIELTIDNYSNEKYRIKWMAGTFLWGDRNLETGNPFYSTYLELRLPFKFFGLDSEPFAGFTPFKGFYAEKFAVINTGICFRKQIDVNLPFTFPLSLSFVSNPYSGSNYIHFSGGISF